ncbi:hypothetical protein G6011_11500 [Alternaria panax]|uniref:DUF6604 domain-containing protein n=1 Tax=Alternaria panax TaxID=48097 RepID=A0AAD4IE50_9PLEO|nr:hypothetical protein G6011_11500 [Alternaria panax]
MTSDPRDEATKESNAGHKSFIELLEDILEILKPKQPQTQRQPLKTAKATSIHTSNAYKRLEVAEPLDRKDMPDIIESAARHIKEKVIYMLEPSDADACCKTYLARVYEGDIGLQAPALTINSALAIIEKSGNEFEKAQPRFLQTDNNFMHLELLKFVHEDYHKDTDALIFIVLGNEDEDPSNYRDGAQTLSPSTIMCAHTVDLVLHTFFARGGQDRLRLSSDEKRFLKCPSQTGSMPNSTCPDDKVLDAAWYMLHRCDLRSWIVFTFQIYWDTQRELGEKNMYIAEQSLVTTATELADDLQGYLNTKALEKIGNSHKDNRGFFEERMDILKSAACRTSF